MYEYQYNNDEKLIKEIRYTQYGDVEYTKEYYYNSNETLSKAIFDYTDDHIDYEILYKCDADGNVVYEEWNFIGTPYMMEQQREKEFKDRQIIYEYDSMGHLIYPANLFGKNRYDNMYDENGRLQKVVCYTSEGEIVDYDEYEYDSSGRPQKKISYSSEGEMMAYIDYEYKNDEYKQ